jgi:hypothetical protein
MNKLLKSMAFALLLQNIAIMAFRVTPDMGVASNTVTVVAPLPPAHPQASVTGTRLGNHTYMIPDNETFRAILDDLTARPQQEQTRRQNPISFGRGILDCTVFTLATVGVIYGCQATASFAHRKNYFFPFSGALTGLASTVFGALNTINGQNQRYWGEWVFTALSLMMLCFPVDILAMKAGNDINSLKKLKRI